MKTEVLIVGDGIAGSMLAFSLLQKKIPFKLFSTNEENSSRIAAGICNPIVFKRMNKSWMAKTLLPHAKKRYDEASELLNDSIISPVKIYKLINSADEQRLWKSALNDVEIMDFIDYTEKGIEELSVFKKGTAIGTSFGYQVNSSNFISKLLAQLKERNVLIEEEFNHRDLMVDENKIHWKRESFKSIVFCEGHMVRNNPYFNYLPFKPVKGEVLLVKIPGYKSPNVVNDKISICPVKDDVFWVGATYGWKDIETGTSAEGKKFLVESLERLLNVPYEILDHKSGIRPAVSDRRPLLGEHPLHKDLYILNGFGTKGFMLAPYFTDQLVNAMLKKGTIDKEVDINRYVKYLTQ